MLKGAIIERGKTGPDVSGKPWKTSCLLVTGVAVSTTLVLGTVYKLLSVPDAESLGLNAAYDTTNNVVLYQHIVDFYDECGAGVPLYLLVIAQSTTLADMIDDTGNAYAKKLLGAGNGDIYNMGIAYNPPAGYTETATDGMNSDVRAAIPKCQALHQWSVDNYMECEIFLECRAYGGTASAALDLRNIPDTPSGIQENDKVSLVIGQDYDFAATLTGLAQKYAGVGKLLGTNAACDLNQDIAEVESFNLTKDTKSRWITAGLSNHTKVSANQADIDTLITKGYIFADLYAGISGYRWSCDATCTPVIIDEDNNMNEHKISYSRTMIHLSRQLRAKLLPEIRKVKQVDPSTGKMASGVIKSLEGKGDDVIEDFENKSWLSGGATTVDPNSDILTPPYAVDMYFSAVPFGTIGQINGKVNLKKSI